MKKLSLTTIGALATYNWTDAEIAVLMDEGIEGVEDKFVNMDEDLFDRLVEAYHRWIEDKRHRQLWKLLDLAGVTEPELDIYLTW